MSTRRPATWAAGLLQEAIHKDDRTAVVRLQGRATIPMLASVVRVFGGSVTITVESRARAGLQ